MRIIYTSLTVSRMNISWQLSISGLAATTCAAMGQRRTHPQLCFDAFQSVDRSLRPTIRAASERQGTPAACGAWPNIRHMWEDGIKLSRHGVIVHSRKKKLPVTTQIKWCD